MKQAAEHNPAACFFYQRMYRFKRPVSLTRQVLSLSITILSALCSLLFALYSLPYALCAMPYALCAMPYALCALHSALQSKTLLPLPSLQTITKQLPPKSFAGVFIEIAFTFASPEIADRY